MHCVTFVHSFFVVVFFFFFFVVVVVVFFCFFVFSCDYNLSFS